MCACVQHCNCICRQCRKCRERRKNDNGMNRWDRTPNPSDCTCRSEHTQTIGSNAKRYHRNETTNHATTFSPVLPTTSVLTLSRRHPQSWTGLQARAPSTGTCKLHGATWNTNICPVSVTTKQTSHTCQTIHEPIQTCPISMDAWKQLFAWPAHVWLHPPGLPSWGLLGVSHYLHRRHQRLTENQQLSHETPNYTSIIDNVFFINTTYSISLRNNDNM